MASTRPDLAVAPLPLRWGVPSNGPPEDLLFATSLTSNTLLMPVAPTRCFAAGAPLRCAPPGDCPRCPPRLAMTRADLRPPAPATGHGLRAGVRVETVAIRASPGCAGDLGGCPGRRRSEWRLGRPAIWASLGAVGDLGGAWGVSARAAPGECRRGRRAVRRARPSRAAARSTG